MWDEKSCSPTRISTAASVYHFLGIPTYLFTPIFVCSRITGWSAHVMEQRSNNKPAHPAGADYVGPGLQKWLPIEEPRGLKPVISPAMRATATTGKHDLTSTFDRQNAPNPTNC
jgi:hypothetical protein